MHAILRITVLLMEKHSSYVAINYACWLLPKSAYVMSRILFFCSTVPCPRMIRSPMPVSVSPGRTAIFNCLAWSYGGLVYDWKRNYTSVIPTNAVTSFKKWSSPDDSSFSSMSYQLKIPAVNTSHEDYYCCVATNPCGSIIRCAWLEVDSKFVHDMTSDIHIITSLCL